MGFTVEEVLENGRTIYILKGDEDATEIPDGYFENIEMLRCGNYRAPSSRTFYMIESRTHFFKEHPEYSDKNIRVDLSMCHQLKRIGEDVFKHSLIESILFPPNIEEICTGAFYGCSKLFDVNFSKYERLVEIENYAFTESAIESIILSPNIETINQHVFWNCKRLKKADFSNCNQLKYMGHNSFLGSAIEQIKLPPSIIGISYSAFGDCKQLTIVDFSNCKKLSYIGAGAFKGSNINELMLPKHFFENKTEEEKHLKLTEMFRGSHENVKIANDNDKITISLSGQLTLFKNNSSDVTSVNVTEFVTDTQQKTPLNVGSKGSITDFKGDNCKE